MSKMIVSAILVLSALFLIAGCGGGLSKSECALEAIRLAERFQQAQSEADAMDIMREMEELEEDCAKYV